MAKPLNEYALYRGDQFICIGTAKECAERIGVDVKTIYWYLSPVYHQRISQNPTDNQIVLVKFDDEVIV